MFQRFFQSHRELVFVVAELATFRRARPLLFEVLLRGHGEDKFLFAVDADQELRLSSILAWHTFPRVGIGGG